MPSRPGAVPASAFTRPMPDRGNLPLRVAVYSELAQAIRSGAVGLGQLLPSEPELSSAFRVSRSVMREALILLEEDGLIRNRRGIGRFVVEVLPEIGLEQLQPIERMLAAPGQAHSVQRRKATLEASTDFTQRGLRLDDRASVLMWESVIISNDLPIALAQEWVLGGEALAATRPGLAEVLAKRDTDAVSMFTVLSDLLGTALGPGECEVSVSTTGSERAHALRVTASSPVLVLSQRVQLDGSPIYVAKHLITPEAGHLTVMQTASP